MEDENKRLKMAIIAGASRAVKYKEKKPRANEQEIIQHITSSVEEILKEIDEEL